MVRLTCEHIPGAANLLTERLRTYPAFHLTQEQMFELAKKREPGTNDIFPPFPQFCILPDQGWFDVPAPTPEQIAEFRNELGADFSNTMNRATRARFMGVCVAQAPDKSIMFLFGYERITQYNQHHVFVGHARLGDDSPALDVAAPRITVVHGDDSRAKEIDVLQRQVNQLMQIGACLGPRFLVMLNHRKVQVIEKTMNRAERKQHGDAKRPNYGIYIPRTITISQAVQEASRGENVREREAHMVRGHLRTDRQGRKRIRVRPHARCAHDGIIPPIKSYQAYNVEPE